MRLLLVITTILLITGLTSRAKAPVSPHPQIVTQGEMLPARATTNDGNWIALNKAITLAKKDHKKVLIDFMADWCTYCKKMDKEVFPDQQVQKLLGRYFYTVRIDVESKDQVTFRGKTYTKAEFAQAFGISGLPTYVFIDSDGGYIANQPGYMPAHTFAEMLSYIGSDAYKKMNFKTYRDSTGN